MVTDEERSEVAERLRCAAEQRQPYTQPTLARFVGADCADIWTRLADLIDPDTTSDTTKSAEDTTKVPDSHPDCGTAEASASRVPECDATAAHAVAESGHESGQNRDSVQIRIQKGPECDRDALLALVREMKHSVTYPESCPVLTFGAASLVMDYARRIAEACGEVA